MDIGKIPVNPRINYKPASEAKKQESGAGETGSAEHVDRPESMLLPEAGIYEKSSSSVTEHFTYQPVRKKLTSDEIQSIREQQEQERSEMIRQFIQDTIHSQNRLLGRKDELSGANGEEAVSQSETERAEEELAASNKLLTSIFGSMEKAYPPIDQTPEGAAKAIEEGGSYSVGAVAERIMTMAVYIAGDDPEKLKQMRDSVITGFEQAGAAVQSATNGGLPSISHETYAEIMRRFDVLIADAGSQTSIPGDESSQSEGRE